MYEATFRYVQEAKAQQQILFAITQHVTRSGRFSTLAVVGERLH